MKIKSIFAVFIVMIISYAFAIGASAWDKVFFKDDFTSYTSTNSLFGNSDKWTDFKNRGFTQWTPAVTTDPADKSNKVLALDKNTASASNKNEHLTGILETTDGQLECSLKFYIPSTVTQNGITYNSTESGENITVSMVDSANAASLLVYTYIIPNAPGGSQVYSHGQTQSVSRDTWHTLRMTVNTKTATRETYLDGELIYSSGVIAALEGKSMSELRISVPGTLPETMVYVDDIKVKKTDGVWNYKISEIQYTDGNVFYKVPTKGTTVKSISLAKADSADGNGMVALAYFDKHNRLTSIKMAEFSESDFDENDEVKLNINMPLPEKSADFDGGEMKIFVWDSENRLSPLADVHTPEDKDVVPTLFLAGDSTMETYPETSFPRAGIGQMLGDYFDKAEVVNYGSSGKTTSTYLSYTGWTEILENVTPGDYVIIQLGINDALKDVGTDVYYNNLETMTDTLLEKGVNVIVNTPTIRRMFSNGVFRATFDEDGNFVSTDVYTFAGGNYLETVKSFIAERTGSEGFFSIDMTKIAAEMIGPNAAFDDSSRRYYMQDAYYNWDSVYAPDERAAGSKYADKTSNNYISCAGDHTHFTIYGATVTAQKMAQKISELDIPLSDYVINTDKTVNYPDGLLSEGLAGETVLTRMSTSASSEVDEHPVSYATDSNPFTYWQADKGDSPEDKGLSLKVTKSDKDSDAVKVSYSFSPESNLLILEQDVLTTDTTDENALTYFYSSDGKIALTTVITDSQMIATGTTLLNDVEPHTWYHLKYVMNISTRTCDIYLDGELKAKNKSFRDDAADISKIQYHILNGSSGTFYVDNIKITVGSESATPILSETFESYTESTTLPAGWGKSNADDSGVSHYIPYTGEKYPQRVIVDFKRIGYIEEAEITFPLGKFYKFEAEVSKDGRAFTHVALFDDKYYGGSVSFAFSPVEARYLRITFLEGKDGVAAALGGIDAKWQSKTPLENLAFTATVSVSSELGSEYDKRGLNDNIIASFDKIGEWRPASNDSAPWAQLKWNEEKTIDRVVLYGSATTGDNVTKGTLIFSDGSRIDVTDIPKTGEPLVIDFEAKKVTWVRFSVSKFSGEAALSEIQVYPVGDKPELVEYIAPWKVVTINEDYASKWLVSADIDDDGEVELISCRSQSEAFNVDNHEVRTACAMELDGSLIWTWGVKGEGVTTLGADSPCQVYDIDNDGTFEVLLCTQTELVILNAKTGTEEKRYPLPVGISHPEEWATDCIVIANISGNDYPSDIIVKSRYYEAWAYTKDWEPIWYVSMPGGMNIGHQPLPVDIDYDGRDEVMVGYSLVNPDGSYRWIIDKNEYSSDLTKGHVDSVKILNYSKGTKPEDIRICLCLCGACDIVMIDGNGKRVWAEEDGMHYETILTGNLKKDSDEVFVVSNPNYPRWMNSESGNQPIYIHDIEGNLLVKRFGFEWNRKPSIINWSGNEDWIYMPADGVLLDINMNIMARTLSPVRGHDSEMAYNINIGDKTYHLDFNGDGRQDLANLTDEGGKVELYIYLNKNGKIVADDIGSGYNVTFY